jgi:hypothetical protein
VHIERAAWPKWCCTHGIACSLTFKACCTTTPTNALIGPATRRKRTSNVIAAASEERPPKRPTHPVVKWTG